MLLAVRRLSWQERRSYTVMLPHEIQMRICANLPQMLDTLTALIAFPSIAAPKPESGYPYGKPCADALRFMLSELEQLGLTCHNYDNHMGAADWDPSLPPHLGILCHLDVVPAVPEQWQSDPFLAEIRSGRIYGRGAIDDKGPAVSVLYALRAIREAGFPLKRNVRFLLGCNEENGSSDLAYYLQKDKMPPQVFTPDGSYPLIHLEKGMLRLEFYKKTKDHIAQFDGGTVPNAVPASAQAVLSDGRTMSYQGTAAHASTPESGNNAVTGLLAKLAGTDPDAFADCTALTCLFPHGCADGTGLGIACADAESGALTCICSTLHVRNGEIRGCVDIRFPICTTKEQLLQRIRQKFQASGFSLEILLQSDPHHTPKDTPLVKQLLEVYEEQTGEPGACIAIGGGTYVHDIPGGVAFGMEYPGWDYQMHGDNEFIPLDQLRRNTEMMAAAIVKICG